MRETEIKITITRPIRGKRGKAIQFELPADRPSLDRALRRMARALDEHVEMDDEYRAGMAMVLGGLERMRESSSLPLQPAVGRPQKTKEKRR